jgi:hypothetical protein
MPDDADTQSSQGVCQPSASTPERPKPPDILEREEQQPAKSPFQRLIERIAV